MKYNFAEDINLPKRPFYIMGILNVTPDSFSDGGKYNSVNTAVEHALKLLDDGADIIDIGGESTRPGAPQVGMVEEIQRVDPVIKAILKERPDTIISIDTTKSVVAEQAVNSGAKIINDISGLNFDPQILGIAKKYDRPLILMHMKGNPRNMQNNPFYGNVIEEIKYYFQQRIDLCKAKGFEKLILDPGIGFGKRVIDNYEILANTEEFVNLGYPILIGLSRKSFLGKSLSLTVEERDNSTIIAEYEAVKRKCSIIRTHNVKNAFEARQLMSFINNPELTKDV